MVSIVRAHSFFNNFLWPIRLSAAASGKLVLDIVVSHAVYRHILTAVCECEIENRSSAYNVLTYILYTATVILVKVKVGISSSILIATITILVKLCTYIIKTCLSLSVVVLATRFEISRLVN